MNRTKINYSIDALAFVGFLFLSSTGILLRYSLPPGSGGLHQNGGSHGKSHLELWGWTRHEWGNFHYYIALAFMAVLVLHLVLHWRWIICVTRGKPSDRSGYRLALGTIGLVSTILLALAPIFSPVQQASDEQINSGYLHTESSEDIKSIRGNMTLEEIATLTDVPVSYLLKKLQLPPDTPPTAQVGRLIRQHGSSMQQLRQIILEAKEQ